MARLELRTDQAHPLSFTQLGFWHMARVMPDEPLRNISGLWRVTGALDVGSLRAALEEIHTRHDLLRSVFEEGDDGPIARVDPEFELDFEVVEVSGSSAQEREARAIRFAQAEKRMPFSVGSGPLSLIRLYVVDEQVCLLLMIVDHIVFDGWSYGVLIDEINRLYPGFCAGRRSALPPLPLQFADFARWERERLERGRMDELWAFWRTRLSGNVPRVPIPTDVPRPRPFQHRQLQFEMDEDLAGAVRSASRRHRVTVFMTLLSAYQLWLWKLSGERDLSVVLPVSNRQRADLRPLIGPVLNLIVLRTRLSPHGSFSELLAEVRRSLLESLAHQEMPFEVLLERLQQHSSYRAMIAMENYPLSDLRLPGSTVELLEGDAGASFYDVTLVVFDWARQIRGYLAYNGELLLPETAQGYVETYVRLLRAALDRPDVPLEQLETAGEVAA